MPLLFSDVDETIIQQKSLAELLHYAGRFSPPLTRSELDELQELFSRLHRGKLSRTEANRRYYRMVLRGRDIGVTREIAETWFDLVLANPSKGIDSDVAAFLAEQQAQGYELILVTGSFAELIAPLARHLRATAILAAPLEKAHGKFTGRLLERPMIGRGKADAVMRYAQLRRVNVEHCIGIGDDPSDLPFLRSVGTVVLPPHAHPVLLDCAKKLGWTSITKGEGLRWRGVGIGSAAAV